MQASTYSSTNGSNGHQLSLDDHIVKATQYVECRRTPTTVPHYYTVLETQQGASISTERLDDGQFTFDCNPKDLEDRNTFAKVLHSTECRAGSVKVGELKKHL